MSAISKAELEKGNQLFTNLIKSIEPTIDSKSTSLKENTVWLQILNESESIKDVVSVNALTELVDYVLSYKYNAILKRIFKARFSKGKTPKQESIALVFSALKKLNSSYGLPYNDILFCFQYYNTHFEKDEHYQEAKNAMVQYTQEHNNAETKFKNIVNQITRLDEADSLTKPYEKDDILGRYFESKWASYNNNFIAIIQHCWAEPQKTQPTKKWLKESIKLAEQIKENETIKNEIDYILSFLTEKANSITSRLNSFATGTIENINPEWGEAHHELNENYSAYYIENINTVGVSYFVWFAALLNSDVTNGLIAKFAKASLKKMKWIGQLSTKNGNACLYAFTLMPTKFGIIQLLDFKNKTQNKNVKKVAQKHIERKAIELNLTKDALLEISTPTFNLENGIKWFDFGNFKGSIDANNLKKTTTTWLNKTTNKEQKAVPKEVREHYKNELKQFKATQKEVSTALQVHTKRLEHIFINNIEWSLENWKEYYTLHPFLSLFTPKLVWLFDNEQTAILKDNQLIDFENNVLNIEDYKSVKLWHPIYSSEKTVINWRNFILDNQIEQPFKQAFREVYKVTDAERNTTTYSNRFAAHFLYQHQFAALAKARDWNYTLQGDFDSYNTPTKNLPAYQLKVEYSVEPVLNSLNESFIYSYIASDQVRFYKGNEILEVQDIPEIVFSEIMRDVDLFVGVSSIGNNPEWQDGGETQTYWNNYSFKELTEAGKMRKSVLEMILPKLNIHKQCKIDGKYLIVKGNLRTYKIHIGSGNILMLPNDEYLCIVTNTKASQKKIFLPFDDDKTLSIILSKAILLSKDDKIKDPTIVSQIKP